MHRLIVLIAFTGLLGGPEVRADSPTLEPASRAWAVTDAVLARHLDPPLRQQMLLAGIKAMVLSARVDTPVGLARRVSDLSGPDQLAALMADVLAGPKVDAPPANPRRPSPLDGLSPTEAFFEGLESAVPGGAVLMSEKERKVQESFAANLYVGVQVQLGVDEPSKQPVFIKVLEGGPADHAGAKDGDLVVEIAGDSTAGMPLAGAVDRLRGPEGTEVLVRFKHPGNDEVFTRSMIRGRLPRQTIVGLDPLGGERRGVRFDGPAPIGYLKITEVTGSTPQELRAFAAQLESEEIKALVLDLRDVESAALHPTILLADALLDGGVIGRIRSATDEKVVRAEPDSLFRGWPIVVLADGHRPEEITWLCDALRDNQRATILGDAAFLKDPLVSEVVSLPGGEWSVKMATGRLARGNGRPLSHQAKMTPNVAASTEPERRAAALRDLINVRMAGTTNEGEGRPKVATPKGLEEKLGRFFGGSSKPADPNYAPPAATAVGTDREEAARKQARERDLAKARGILAEALKSAEK